MSYSYIDNDGSIKRIDSPSERLIDIYRKKIGNQFSSVSDIKPSIRLRVLKIYSNQFKINLKKISSFTPVVGETYYYFENPFMVESKVYLGLNLVDILNIAIGNCFSSRSEITEEEAVEVSRLIRNSSPFDISYL